jgi:hypothetical protein
MYIVEGTGLSLAQAAGILFLYLAGTGFLLYIFCRRHWAIPCTNSRHIFWKVSACVHLL